MTDSNQNPDIHVPFSQNINIVQIIAAGAMILAMFGIDLDPKTQAAIVSVIVAGSALVTWVLHTFVNHPANQVAAKVAMAKAVNVAKRAAPMLLACVMAVMLLSSLSACAVLGGGGNVSGELQVVEAGFTTAQVLYNSACAANAGASFCSAKDMQIANDAADAVRNAIQAASSILASPGSTSNQIAAAIKAAVQAEADFARVINDLQAKKAKAMARAASH